MGDFVREILTSLYDFPLQDKELLVNRQNELSLLNRVVSFQPSGVYGLCGETGIGKTTILNFIKPGYGNVYYLRLTEKESKESIIADLIYKLATSVKKVENDKEILKYSENLIDFVISEKSETLSFTGGGRIGISAEVSKETSKARKFHTYEAYTYLDEFLELLVGKFRRVTVLIDELDKEKKEEVLLILDSLKAIFEKVGLIVVISLPFSIYREYAKDRMRWNESGNLENIIKDVTFLEPFSEKEIQEIILKRLSKYPDYFDGSALFEIARFSDGNPRDALWIAQQVVYENFDARNIDGGTARKSIKKVVERYFSKSLEISEMQKEILKYISENPGTKNVIVENLSQKGFKKQTIYTYLQRLKDSGFILQKDDELRVSGKIFYLL